MSSSNLTGGGVQLPPHSDNVDEELRRIESALNAVFVPAQQQQQDNAFFQQRQMADMYLTSFQSTSTAWIVCDRLLSLPNQQSHVSFFAAQTLHTKCRSHAHQLPSDSLPSLRDSLFSKLVAASHQQALFTRLAMAIAALAVQMSWMTVIPDLLAQKEAQPGVVMEILRVLPEECASDRLLLTNETTRYQMRDALVNQSQSVLATCQMYIESHKNDEKSVRQVYTTVFAWIRYVPIPPQVLVQQFELLKMAVNQVLQYERQPSIGEVATDVLVEVLRMYPSHLSANQSLVQQLAPLLSSTLQPAFQMYFDRMQKSSDAHDISDVLRAHTRIVSEMGESYLSLILEQYGQAKPLVEWILQCSSIVVDKEIASMTLHFWYKFVMDLESIEPYAMRQSVIDEYTQILLRLLDTFSGNLLLYPQDIDDVPDDVMDDVINRNRYYVADTILDTCRLLGGNAVLQRLATSLQQQVAANPGLFTTPGNESLNQTNSNNWQGVEACLYAISSVSMYVAADENQYLHHVLDLIPRLPPRILPLRYTASMLIGKYASWLAKHDSLLQGLLPYLAQGLDLPICVTAAAISIKHLCQDLDMLGESVMQLYQQVVAKVIQQESNENANPAIKLTDELEILEGVCSSLSRQYRYPEDSEKSMPFLSQLVQPMGTRLSNLLVLEPSSTALNQVISEVQRFTMICRYWKPATPSNTQQHPILQVIQSCWSLLDSATKKYPSSVNLAEHISRFHKHSLRTCGARVYAPMLEPLLQQLVTSFDLTKQSPYLYCVSICVTEYGRDTQYTPVLLKAVGVMVQSTLGMLQDNLEVMTAHPDVVEELFYLLGRLVRYCGNALFVGLSDHPLQVLANLFQSAVLGLRLHHYNAHVASIHFLETVVGHGVQLQETQSQVQPEGNSNAVALSTIQQSTAQNGQALLSACIGCLTGDLPDYRLVRKNEKDNSISGLLYKTTALCVRGGAQQMLDGWIHEALNSRAVPASSANEFLVSGIFSSSNPMPRNEFDIVLKAFASSCERNRKLQS